MASWLSSSALSSTIDFFILVQILTTDFLNGNDYQNLKSKEKVIDHQGCYTFISFKRHFGDNKENGEKSNYP